MSRTKYSWQEYKAKAETLYKQGKKVAEIKKILGDPYWEGKPWHIKSTGRGKLGRMDLAKRRNNQAVNQANRKRAENVTLPEHRKDPVNKRELRRQNRERAAANRQHGRASHHLDHVYSQNQLNQKTDGQGPRIRNRTIRGIEAEVGHPVGEHYLNKELVTAEENQRRNGQDLKQNPPRRLSRAKDRITTSKSNSGITNILDVLVAGGKRGLTKAARNGAPVVGTTMDALDTADRYNEFRQQPNLMNAAQLTTSAISTGANMISDVALATGVGAPVAAVAEKVGGIMNIFEGGLEGLETYNSLPEASRRRFESRVYPNNQ
tara:strand:- start:44 stop:1003 length:960 start_codon:yes stop_codon:yes gene_type:complete